MLNWHLPYQLQVDHSCIDCWAHQLQLGWLHVVSLSQSDGQQEVKCTLPTYYVGIRESALVWESIPLDWLGPGWGFHLQLTGTSHLEDGSKKNCQNLPPLFEAVGHLPQALNSIHVKLNNIKLIFSSCNVWNIYLAKINK